MKRKKPSKLSGRKTVANPEVEQIEHLLKTMAEHNLEEFEYSRGDLRIRLKKPSAGVAYAAVPVPAPEIIVAGGGPALTASAPAAALATPEARPTEDLHLVKSPIVGTFYASPSPGAEAFVKVGGYIEAGQTLCIVEAMKLMNEIESDADGEVVKRLVTNGQPVEYGQPLFALRLL
jgi:acetyl-CoA carboxylase biotin carboxyl carrier protein